VETVKAARQLVEADLLPKTIHAGSRVRRPAHFPLRKSPTTVASAYVTNVIWCVYLNLESIRIEKFE
jgi:hypothetical protein